MHPAGTELAANNGAAHISHGDRMSTQVVLYGIFLASAAPLLPFSVATLAAFGTVAKTYHSNFDNYCSIGEAARVA
jgi:hypothetical protein